jgi:DNA helicase II / ATP-dependent DNA helicase PcrA
MDVLRQAFGTNEVQLHAAADVEGPLVLLAGPGSGKTRVLTHRVAYIHRATPGARWRVLALTFTNKAAAEMKQRLARIPGFNARRAFVGTVHAFCSWVLRSYGCYGGIPPQFTQIDEEEQLDIIQDLIAESGLPIAEPASIRGVIEEAKRKLLAPEDFRQRLEDAGRTITPAEYYAAYQDALRLAHALDYNDLLLHTIRLLTDVPAVQRILTRAFPFVCIDEGQDTNLAQLALLYGLVPTHKPNLLVVADEDQSIYEWNHARMENLREIIAHYEARVHNLNMNYRCPPVVLRMANRLIAENAYRFADLKADLTPDPDKDEGTGNEVVFIEARDPREEADLLSMVIQKRLHDGHQAGEIAVIGWARFLFEHLKVVLDQEGIPWVLIGDESFLSSKEISVLLAGLRLLVNPADLNSLRRVARAVAPKSYRAFAVIQRHLYVSGQRLPDVAERLDKIPGVDIEMGLALSDLYRALCRSASSLLTVPAAVAYIERVLGIRQRVQTYSQEARLAALARLDAFNAFCCRFHQEAEDKSVQIFLAEVTLFKSKFDASSYQKEDPERVKLITIHAAKGTEYPVVILIGLEEGIFPDYRAVQAEKRGNPRPMEEERRSCFVAVTRAMQELILVHTHDRPYKGNSWMREPSRFLLAMGANFLD